MYLIIFTSFCEQVGKQKFQPRFLKDLDCVFGKRWHIRIFNQLGDYAKIDNNKTFYISITNPRNITEYSYHGGKYIEEVKETRPSMVVNFVRLDRNKDDYEEELKM